MTAPSLSVGHTPGQLLHALMVTQFNGGGWVEAPEWGDYDEAGHAEWERMAAIIGKNVRPASAAPDLLGALQDLHQYTVVGTDEQRHAALNKAWAAIWKANGETPPVVSEGE